MLKRALASGSVVRYRYSARAWPRCYATATCCISSSVRSTDFARGDIVVIHQAGQFLTHRIIAVHADWIETRGDNSCAPDPAPHRRIIVGRVSAFERGSICRRLDDAPWTIRRRQCWVGWLWRRLASGTAGQGVLGATVSHACDTAAASSTTRTAAKPDGSAHSLHIPSQGEK